MTEEMMVAVASRYKKRARPINFYSGVCVCGEIFYFRNLRPSALYCSHGCYAKDATPRRSGTAHHNYKAGFSVSKNNRGYLTWSWKNPNGKHISILEHRIVMMREIGRELKDFENVHHKNGIRTDNRVENLELWTKPQTSGQRVEDLVDWVLDNYEKEIEAKMEVRRLVRQVIARVSEPAIKNGRP